MLALRALGEQQSVDDSQWQRLQEELTRFARNTQRRDDQQRGQRVGERETQIWQDAEGRVELARREAEAVGRTAGETARLRFEQQLLQQLRRAGVNVDAEWAEDIRKFGDALEQATNKSADLRRSLEQVQAYGNVFSSSLERAFSSWLSGAEVNWKTFFNKLVADLATLALRQNVLQPLFGGGGVQGGGLFGSLIQGLTGGGNGGWVTTVTPRAEGGPITAGLPYWVGERGPELVVPRMDGTVVPHGAAVPARGETRVTVNNYAGAEVEAGEGDDGEVQINIIRAVVRDEFASGRMNPVMAAKHGIRPRLRAR
jgi:hypothetical protein